MTLPLPPLTAIRVFEAVARHQSFTRAANELGMTQAAVSYQIKLLEERFGGPLFLRRPKQVELTEAGQRLAPSVSEAFSLLAQAYASARGDAEGVLTVTASITFATTWLARHVGAFQIRYPSLAVRIDATNQAVDFARSDIDLAIRHGDGNWPGLCSHRLLSGEYSPMLSPKLAATIGGVKQPADLLRLPLLDPGDIWWDDWFDLVKVARRPRGPARGEAQALPAITRGQDRFGSIHRGPVEIPCIGSQAFVGTAALDGQGVAILSCALWAQDLAEGRLIQPFRQVAGEHAFYLVYPEARRNLPKIRVFRDWILEEVGRTAGIGNRGEEAMAS
ncbi:LysR family transcriptional regulator [Labrys sp. LIt4]|uniref:LysR substrate-binding domain-containing protein n=1 Tax=Labrys sp. LIt4 TaxID=2821355 RepID=UPI001ADF77C2|nr:LysR substrate-binding domain-containing protein [Labrys sp. LIt4]MBP0581776.1 LysR family transcriptional regulator [Labrys sp. LIt4]